MIKLKCDRFENLNVSREKGWQETMYADLMPELKLPSVFTQRLNAGKTLIVFAFFWRKQRWLLFSSGKKPLMYSWIAVTQIVITFIDNHSPKGIATVTAKPKCFNQEFGE